MTDLVCAGGVAEQQLLQTAASLEKLSEHPLARAIVAQAEARNTEFLPVERFEQIPGQGLRGVIGGQVCLAGNRKLLAANGLEDPALEALQNRLADQGKTPLFFARGGQLLGAIAVADVVKPTSKAAVEELQAMGIEVVMLTGDHSRTAEAIRRQVGVNRVGGRGYCPRTRSGKSAACSRKAARWPWWATASTTPPPWPGRTWVSPSGRVPTWPWNPPISY